MKIRGHNAAAFIAGMLGRRELIAVTGGGGKTTLMFALARALRRGASVVTTTTTHLCPPSPEDSGEVLLGAARWGEWRSALANGGHITVAEAEEDGKLRGFSPETVDEIYRRETARYVIAEADGAKRLPFKAYEEYEPVLPSAATLHIVVIGIEPFLYPVTEENTFRFHLLSRRHGVAPGENLSPERIAAMLNDPREYLKRANPATRRILLVNKCDKADGGRVASLRSALSSRLSAYDCVLFASLREDILYESVTPSCGRTTAYP